MNYHETLTIRDLLLELARYYKHYGIPVRQNDIWLNPLRYTLSAFAGRDLSGLSLTSLLDTMKDCPLPLPAPIHPFGGVVVKNNHVFILPTQALTEITSIKGSYSLPYTEAVVYLSRAIMIEARGEEAGVTPIEEPRLAAEEPYNLGRALAVGSMPSRF